MQVIEKKGNTQERQQKSQIRGFWNVLMRIERRYIIIAYTRGVNILHNPPPRILAEYAPYHSIA